MADDPDAFARDLDRAAMEAKSVVRPVVARSALTVKTTARANAQASSGLHARNAPSTINYSMEESGSWVGAEIGYDRSLGGQSTFGGILEFGSPTSPPHRDLARALEAEQQNFENSVADAIGRLL